jgi:hypothetical protein
MDAKALIEQGEHLFSKRGTLLSMWQDIADNFYCERADFTVTRSLGDSFADNLTTGYPTLIRRDLGNSLGTMMRPSSLNWFHMRTDREDKEDQPAKEWLEWATGVQRRAMYDRASQFTRASKESDHDNAAFGQSVKTVELNREGNGLLYRCWHLRDVAWAEDAEGKICTVHRKWKPTVATLCKTYGNKVHSKVADMMVGANKKPFHEVNCRHVVIPAEECDAAYVGKGRVPYVEVMIDVDHMHVMETVGLAYQKYIIPRWQTVSGSQYSFSPATVCGLPDARLLQAMTRCLLEAGEKFTNPPMLAVQEAIRSDISIYAGGITWVDAAYDERLGEVLRPLSQDKSGVPIGMDMSDRVMAQLREAFFLSKLELPTPDEAMTAYEVAQRVQEYIRQASPLFEPLEDEDNAAVCEATFDLMLRSGAFGSVQDIPQSIRGADIGFKFESPLHEAIERQKGQKFVEAKALLADTLALDPTVGAHIDVTTAFRDVLQSIGVPAEWMRSETEAAEVVAEQEQKIAAAEMIQTMGAGAEAAKTIGEAGQAIDPMGMAA